MSYSGINPYGLGSILGIITIMIGLLLPEPITIMILAILLFGIATVYLGFAVADGRPRAILTETPIILVYLGFAILGITVSAWILVVGYILHGVWDWLHHDEDFGAEVASWYIPFCMLYDWLIAGFLAILLLT